MDYFQLDHSQRLPAMFQSKHRIALEMQSVRQMQFASPLVALFFRFVFLNFISLFPFCFFVFSSFLSSFFTSFHVFYDKISPEMFSKQNKTNKPFSSITIPPKSFYINPKFPMASCGSRVLSSFQHFSLFILKIEKQTNKQTNKTLINIYPLFTQVPLISYTENC